MRRRSPLFRLVSAVLIAAGFTLVSAAGLGAGVFGGLQLRLSDPLLPAAPGDPHISIVGIDADSLTAVAAQTGESWPWARDIHGQIVDRLSAAGARVIVYDLLFDPATEADTALADAEEAAGNVILAGVATFPAVTPPADQRLLSAAAFTPPVPELAGPALAVGHANVTPDPDGVVRALPLVIDAGTLVPALSFQAFATVEGLSGPLTTRPDGVQVGDRVVPTGPLATLDLNFTDALTEGSPDAPVLSAADVLAGDFDEGLVRDRVVFVGVTDPTLGDNKQTPVEKGQGLPGVFIHANALNTMLTGAFLAPATRTANLEAVFALTLAVALAVQFIPLILASLTPFALGFGYLLFAFGRFDNGTVYDLVYPNLGIVVGFVGSLGVRYFTEVRERRRVTATFGRYLAKDVVEEVLASPEGAVATLKGAGRPISVLFADLRGFTAASENAEPEEVVAALNVYLDAMTRAVIEEKGTVDKFMGDCVMAFWGAPRADPDFVARAVRAALKMQDYIDEAMAENAAARELRVKGCGIGVSAGEAVVGNIGSHLRLDYTAIGDTVNTASRLCGVAGPGEVVITHGTAEVLGDDFRLGPLPPLSVKGKALPLRVFQVLRPGQEAKAFTAGETLDATEEKGHFEPELAPVPEPPKAAGYAPVEPAATKPEGSVIGPAEDPGA